MNVVNSSGWLEFFADGPNVKDFAIPLQHTSEGKDERSDKKSEAGLQR